MAKAIKGIVVIGKGLGYGFLGLGIIAIVGFYGFLAWGLTIWAYDDGGLGWAIPMGLASGAMVASVIVYLRSAMRD